MAPSVILSSPSAASPTQLATVSSVAHGEGSTLSASTVALLSAYSVTRAFLRPCGVWQLRSSHSTRNEEHSTAPLESRVNRTEQFSPQGDRSIFEVTDGEKKLEPPKDVHDGIET